MSRKDKKITWGLLDYLDVFLGKVSCSDGVNGTRKRSYGATALVLFSIPLSFLVVAYGVSIIRVPKSRVSTTVVNSSSKCISKRGRERVACLRSAKGTKKTPVGASKGVGSESWPWIGAIVMFLTGVLISLIRRKQDLDRFLTIADKVIEVQKQGSTAPDLLTDALSASVSKVAPLGPRKDNSELFAPPEGVTTKPG